MWGSSELGKLGLGEATSSDSIPVAIRAFAKSTEPYKVGVEPRCSQIMKGDYEIQWKEESSEFEDPCSYLVGFS